MFEVLAIITDELGTRTVPTGDGSINRGIAENLMLRRMIAEPTIPFYVEYIPPEDEFNAY